MPICEVVGCNALAMGDRNVYHMDSEGVTGRHANLCARHYFATDDTVIEL